MQRRQNLIITKNTQREVTSGFEDPGKAELH